MGLHRKKWNLLLHISVSIQIYDMPLLFVVGNWPVSTLIEAKGTKTQQKILTVYFYF